MIGFEQNTLSRPAATVPAAEAIAVEHVEADADSHLGSLLETVMSQELPTLLDQPEGHVIHRWLAGRFDEAPTVRSTSTT